jgi:hypothetical protein
LASAGLAERCAGHRTGTTSRQAAQGRDVGQMCAKGGHFWCPGRLTESSGLPVMLAARGRRGGRLPRLNGLGSEVVGCGSRQVRPPGIDPGGLARVGSECRQRQRPGAPSQRALLFRTLATLRTDIALFEDVDELQWQGPNAGFDSLGARLVAAVSRSRQHAGRLSQDRSDPR